MSEKKNSDIIKQEDHAKVEKYSTFEEFNENTLRVRRNLLIFSVIALFYKLSGATLTDKSSFLGLEFEHTDPEMIDLFLLCIVGYHLVHFIWLAHEDFVYHDTRNLTIRHKEFERKYLNDKIDPPTMIGDENKKNGIIGIWWSLRTSIKKNIEQTGKKIEKVELKIKNLEGIEEIKEELKIIKLEVEAHKNKIIEKAKEIGGILESRKEKSEVRFIKINAWRYHLIETYFPMLIGIFASFVLEVL
jgi:hypothetical protein